MARSDEKHAKLTRTKRTQDPFLSGWIRIILHALPLLSFGLGIWFLAEALKFHDTASQTQGKVVELIRDARGDGISYTPVFEYQAHDGRIYLGETHISSSSYNYRIGERVQILYSLDDPSEVRVNPTFSLYGPGLIFAVVGGVFLLVLGFVRRKAAQAKNGLAEIARRETEARGTTKRKQQPTTDPSQYGHVHEPKPKREPTVRRMR